MQAKDHFLARPRDGTAGQPDPGTVQDMGVLAAYSGGVAK